MDDGRTVDEATVDDAVIEDATVVDVTADGSVTDDEPTPPAPDEGDHVDGSGADGSDAEGRSDDGSDAEGRSDDGSDAEGIDGDAALELNRRFAEVRRAIGALEKVLLQGPRHYSRRELAEEQGVPERLTAVYWRSMGFTAVDPDTIVFTEDDADAIGDLAALVEDGEISERTFATLSRGLGYHMGRLAMWLTEALVDEAKAAQGMTDAQARQHMLEQIPRFLEVFEDQTLYVFRRRLAAYAARAGSEVLHMAATEQDPDELFPLQRAVGFADLVQFTRLSQSLSGSELAHVIGDFEAICRDIVSVGGGRVVKTVGDEIMFLADTPEDGAQIALSLSEAIAAEPGLPDVRVGLAWGSMFSRYGDVFGPTVNLAARLEGVAEPGAVVVDADTQRAIEAALPGSFVELARSVHELHGIGDVEAVKLGRGDAAPLSLGL
ncbi:adenylate/guanylate cyclase domain-containing protein [Brachybacterium nesterenkovii]|uniref:Adenylate cyclase n=1 Tax=Brachybacterium nesterenkovii TaxID=47847 RepID=A0A1X6WYB7_9MICO|nr:adenylate/guanylate cyclase domain-containing protein [Brachybacterium nesterenkovii]SLM90821.1 Adenylate cyclase [Brachybacterium nesterenkovii]